MIPKNIRRISLRTFMNEIQLVAGLPSPFSRSLLHNRHIISSEEIPVSNHEFFTHQNIFRTKRNLKWISSKNITIQTSDTFCSLPTSQADRARRSWLPNLVALMKTSLSPSSTRTTMDEPYPHKTTNISQRTKIVWMWISGQSARYIAQETHTSVSTVYRWIRRWEREGSVSTKPRNERTISAWGRCIARARAEQNSRDDFRGGNQLVENRKEVNM